MNQRTKGRTISVAAFLYLIVYTSVQAQPLGSGTDTNPSVSNTDNDTVTLSESVSKLVKERLAAQGKEGPFPLWKELQPKDLDLLDAYAYAVENNLAIQIQRQQQAAASANIDLNKAAFDTSFGVSVAYTRSQFFERSDMITRERETDTTLAGDPSGENISDEQASQDIVNQQSTQEEEPEDIGRLTCVTVDGVVVNPGQCTVETAVTTAEEFASFNSVIAPKATTFSLQAFRLFSWGGSVLAQLQSVRTIKSFYSTLDRLETISGTNTDPIGQGTNFPWTSSFTLSFATPLPYSRNFGGYGALPTVNLALANLDHEISQWQLESALNTVLDQVNTAYWQLVRDQYVFNINVARRQNAEQMMERANRLFDEHRITFYDLTQLQAELERAKIAEEISWNDFLVSSNNLVDLLDQNKLLFIAKDKIQQDLLQTPEFVNPPHEYRAELKAAWDDHPQIRIARLAVERADYLVNHTSENLKPDLSFIFGIDYSQSNRVFGYESWNESVQNVFDPDERGYFVGINYRLPFGRHADKAAWSQARIAKQQAQYGTQITENQIADQVNGTISSIASFRSQARQTNTNLELAKLAYEKAEQLRGQAMISEFDRLRTIDNLFSARLAFTQAVVDYQREKNHMLAVQGRLYQWFQEQRGSQAKGNE